jgi:hypothetical protein
MFLTLIIAGLNMNCKCPSIGYEQRIDFFLVLPVVSKRVSEYDAEGSFANNGIGSSATVTGSEPVYKNIKLKVKTNKKILLG